MKTKMPGQREDLRRKIVIIGIVFLLLIMVVSAIFGKRGLVDIQLAKKKLAVLETERRALSLEKQAIEAEIDRLEKDPKSVEKRAREKLGLIAPGEKVIIISKDPAK